VSPDTASAAGEQRCFESSPAGRCLKATDATTETAVRATPSNAPDFTADAHAVRRLMDNNPVDMSVEDVVGFPGPVSEEAGLQEGGGASDYAAFFVFWEESCAEGLSSLPSSSSALSRGSMPHPQSAGF